MALNVVVTGTSPLFTLDEAKAHLRVDFPDDDTLIQTYSDAAVARVLQYCNLPLVPDTEIAEAAFKVAALIVLADFYSNREPNMSDGSAVRLLIDPYRHLRI